MNTEITKKISANASERIYFEGNRNLKDGYCKSIESIYCFNCRKRPVRIQFLQAFFQNYMQF